MIRKAESAIRRNNTPVLVSHWHQAAPEIPDEPLSRAEREIIRRATIGGYKMYGLSPEPSFSMGLRRS